MEVENKDSEKVRFFYTYCEAENQVDIFASGESLLGFLEDNDIIDGVTGSFLWTKEGWDELHRKSTEAEYKEALEWHKQYPKDHSEPNLDVMLAEETFCIGVHPTMFKELSGIDVTDYYPDLSKAKEADLAKILEMPKKGEFPFVTEISVPEDPA